MKMFYRKAMATAVISGLCLFAGGNPALAAEDSRSQPENALNPAASDPVRDTAGSVQAGGKSANTASSGEASFSPCLLNLKNYRLSDAIAEECLREAETSEASPELLYTVGIWYINGEHDLFVNIAPDERKARHFLYNAAKKGYRDAREAYVITQMNRKANDGVDTKSVAENFLKEMAADTADDGYLRYVTTLKAVHRLKKEDADRVKAMADNDDFKAAFVYADILQSSTGSMKSQADVNKAMKEAEHYYNRVLMHYRDRQDEEARSYVARVYWNLIAYYVKLSQIDQYHEQSQKAVISYLEILAKMGDLIAASNLAVSLHVGDWGVHDDDAAYAWTTWVRKCAPGSIYSQGLKRVSRDLTLKVPVEEMDRRRAKAGEYTRDAICLEKNLPVRPGDMPEGLSAPAEGAGVSDNSPESAGGK